MLIIDKLVELKKEELNNPTDWIQMLLEHISTLVIAWPLIFHMDGVQFKIDIVRLDEERPVPHHFGFQLYNSLVFQQRTSIGWAVITDRPEANNIARQLMQEVQHSPETEEEVATSEEEEVEEVEG